MQCAHCGAAGDSQCAKCKQAYYCGRACQIAGWPAHKKTCKATAAAAAAAVASLGVYMRSRQQKLRREDEAQRELLRRWDAGEFEGVVEIADEATASLEALIAEPGSVRFPLRGAITYATVGNAYTLTGDYRAGLKTFRRAVALLDELDDAHPRKGQIYAGYANALVECGHVAEALVVYKDVLSWAAPDTDAMVSALDDLAGGYAVGCEYDMAATTYTHSLGVALARGDEEKAMRTLQNLGHVRVQMQEPADAYVFYSRCRDIGLRLGFVALTADTSVSMAECRWMQACLSAPNSHAMFVNIAEMQHLLTDTIKLDKTHTAASDDTYRRILLLSAYGCSVAGKSAEAVENIVVMLFSYAKADTASCWGCGQVHTDQCPLLMCRECRLARFCNKDCQRTASSGVLLVDGTCALPHRRLCPMFRAHRKTVADPATPISSKAGIKLRARIQEFLHETTQASRAFAGPFGGSD